MGVNRTSYRTDFTYDSENKPTQLSYGSTSNKVNYTYDAIGRIKTRTVTVSGTGYETSYSYTEGSTGDGTTTPLISKMTQTGETCSYSYDSRGNIQGMRRDGIRTAYVYDAIGQLIRVNDPNDTTSGDTGTTWTYEYDRGGNMLNRKRYDRLSLNAAKRLITL